MHNNGNVELQIVCFRKRTYKIRRKKKKKHRREMTLLHIIHTRSLTHSMLRHASVVFVPFWECFPTVCSGGWRMTSIVILVNVLGMRNGFQCDANRTLSITKLVCVSVYVLFTFSRVCTRNTFSLCMAHIIMVSIIDDCSPWMNHPSISYRCVCILLHINVCMGANFSFWCCCFYCPLQIS